MSRSYKHSPVYTDGRAGGPKTSKQKANKKVRHLDFDELPIKGSAYKKYFSSYEIHDFISYYTLDQALQNWEKHYNTRKECINHWEKYNKRK